MKSLVELYPDLFKVESNPFFDNETLNFSLSVKESIDLLDKRANDYAKKVIEDYKNHQDAVEDCKERYIDGACWYMTNYSKLFALPDKELKIVLKIGRTLYAKNYCKRCFFDLDGMSKNEAEEFVLSIMDDFNEGVKWAAFSKFCQVAEEELKK